jgi:glucosamine-phosphate N-acetyltransferase
MNETLLFDEKLLRRDLEWRWSNDYEVRPLARSDYGRGHCKVLEQLTTVGGVAEREWQARFDEMRALKDLYFVVVVVDKSTDCIAASGTLALEYKFIHRCGRMGHIEDIVVLDSLRGKRVGLHLIEQLKAIGAAVGCYKLVLDCAEKVRPFYERCGFSVKELQMVLYIDGGGKKQRLNAKL